MSDFKEIQDLIRLKRHEQPAPDFVEDFVRSFQQRQRSELLNQSARGLLWERITTYFNGLLAPKWGWAAATCVALAGTFAMLQSGTPGAGIAQNEAPAGKIAPISEEEYKQYLLSDHYKGGFGDEREAQSRITGNLPSLQGGAVPASSHQGFSLDLRQQQ